MDNNIITGDIQSEKLYAAVHIDGGRREQSVEYLLPDYIADVRKVVSFEAKPRLKEEYRTAGSVKYDGEVIYTAILLCEDESINSVSIAGDFDGELVFDERDEAPVIFCAAEDASVRALNPRKLSARCRVAVSGTQDSYIDPSLTPEEDAADLRLEVLHCDCPTMSVCRSAETGMRLSEDIELDAAAPEISRIVFCDVTPCVCECRSLEGSVSIRAQMYVELLYADANGGYYFVSRSIPVNESFPCEGATANGGCFADITIGEIKAQTQTNSFGEEKLVELDCVWDVRIVFKSNRQISAVADVFSPDSGTFAQVDELMSSVFTGASCGNFTFTASKPLEEMGISPECELICARAVPVCREVKRSDTGKLVFSGDLRVYLLCRSGEQVESGEAMLAFRYESMLDPGRNEYECECMVGVGSLKYRMESGKFSVEAELCVGANVSTQVVTSVSSAPDTRESAFGALTLFYPDGETLWEIAKRYGVPADIILEANDAGEEEFLSRRVIMIPQRLRRPSFSRII